MYNSRYKSNIYSFMFVTKILLRRLLLQEDTWLMKFHLFFSKCHDGYIVEGVQKLTLPFLSFEVLKVNLPLQHQ